MEVTRLSVETSYVRRDLDEALALLKAMAHPETGIYTRLTKIEAKLQDIPTRWGVARIVGALLVVVAALSTLLGPPLQRAVWGERAVPIDQPAPTSAPKGGG